MDKWEKKWIKKILEGLNIEFKPIKVEGLKKGIMAVTTIDSSTTINSFKIEKIVESDFNFFLKENRLIIYPKRYMNEAYE